MGSSFVVSFLAMMMAVGFVASSVEVRSMGELEEVRSSPRVALVEFYSAACGYCAEFAPTWDKLVDQASRLESARVNIDDDAGMAIATDLGVLDRGIPAVVIFNTRRRRPRRTPRGDDDAPDADAPDASVLMAGDVFPLSRLLKRVYHATKAQNLRVDDEGYFLKADVAAS